MPNKYQWYVGSLCLVILLGTACAPQPTVSIPQSTVVLSATSLAPIEPSQTSSANFVPKHNDLIFIEFFAVT
jgi:hypothetical protein